MKKFYKILLVEDQEVDAFLTHRLLHYMDIAESITVCKNGREAMSILDALSEETYENEKQAQLILLDINMPGMNGFEFLQKLRDKYDSKYTVVIVSASENPQDIALSARYQVDYYMVKPLTEEKIKRMVNRLF